KSPLTPPARKRIPHSYHSSRARAPRWGCCCCFFTRKHWKTRNTVRLFPVETSSHYSRMFFRHFFLFVKQQQQQVSRCRTGPECRSAGQGLTKDGNTFGCFVTSSIVSAR
ncbi:hypothetical protein AMELA_G00008140, partial [Ameiurus melas]